MNAGEIGSEAGVIFSYNKPHHWILRSQEDQNDHGIDGEIELKNKEGKAIGRESVFKVQIKGEEYSKYIHDGKTLSFNLKMERLRYYFEFKIPVILIVTEVSSEKVFWLSITDNEELKKQSEQNSNNSIQVHIPVENRIIRKNNELAINLISSVNSCWSYLSIKGVKHAVSNSKDLSPESLDKRIEDVGDALYIAYNQKLNNLFIENDFNSVYDLSSKIINAELTPEKERFIALLYFEKTFAVAPFTAIKKEQLNESQKIHFLLLKTARKEKLAHHRLIAIGKVRSFIFSLKFDQLYYTDHANKSFKENSFESMIFNNGTFELYSDCCKDLEKIVVLFNRLIAINQFNIFCDLFIGIYSKMLIFRDIHSGRGSKESISFFNNWLDSMALIAINYTLLVKDSYRLRELYFLYSHPLFNTKNDLGKVRELVLKTCPDLIESLDYIEKKNSGAAKKFYELSIEKQKIELESKAIHLGMDPNDPECRYGQVVSMALKNYDPSLIIKNCEHLFVDYRGGGIIAQSLQMHSAGGLHWLICLKHKHAKGTGNLLINLYDQENKNDFLKGFKQTFCDNCNDCSARSDDWEWSLIWQQENRIKNQEILDVYQLP